MEKKPQTCSHCQKELETSREQFVGICSACRHYGLVNGKWPDKQTIEEKL